MTLEEAVGALAIAGNVLPREALQWSLDHWDEAGPRFVRMIDDYIAGADRSDAAVNTLFFAAHLIGEKADTASFAALCRLLHNADATDTILGDAVTETLCGILISAYDGNADHLKAVVENPNAEDFARSAALIAMVYLTHAGRLANAETHEYLGALRAKLHPRGDEIVLAQWALAAAYLGYDDFLPRIETLFRHPAMDTGFLRVDDVHKQFQAMRDAPDKVKELASDSIIPFTDAIGTLGSWHGFSETARRENELALAADDDVPRAEREMSYINPYRDVCRNDPCPCGSGKKYKKCCLAGSKEVPRTAVSGF